MNFKQTLLLFLIFFILTSCASKKPKNFIFEHIKKEEKVVVLPLKNNTKSIIIGRIIYRILMVKLVESKIFKPVAEGVIREFMIKNMLYPGDIPNLNQLAILKKITGAKIVIGGNVVDAGIINDDVKITLILWARNINNGKLMWTTYYVKRGEDYRKIFHFGKLFSLGELANRMVEDIVISWIEKGG